MKATDSATMARFSCRVVRSASSTCSVQALPTRVTIGVCAASSAARLASSSVLRRGGLVDPNAASVVSPAPELSNTSWGGRRKWRTGSPRAA